MNSDAQISMELRDAGMGRALENAGDEWRAEVDRVVRAMAPGQLVTGETIRLRCRVQPHHPNAWGAVINGYVRRGLLVPTGQYTKMQAPRSHARMTPVYRRAAGRNA